jgi:hypothetical protein
LYFSEIFDIFYDGYSKLLYLSFSEMANPAELWVKEYGEASRLADQVTKMLSDRGSLPPSGPETQRYLSGMRR